MYKTEARLKIKKAFSASTRCEEKTIEISSIIGLENYLKKFNSIASYSSIAYEFPSGEVNKWILNKKKKLLLPKIDSQKKKSRKDQRSVKLRIQIFKTKMAKILTLS